MGGKFRKRFKFYLFFFLKEGILEAVAGSEPGFKHCNGQEWG